MPEALPLRPDASAATDALRQAAARIEGLRQHPEALGGAVDEPVECIETHISWVLLAGDWAIKFKKPVRLDFLEFSTLAQRRLVCEDELRINRRTAPQLYDAVVGVTGTVDAPRIAPLDQIDPAALLDVGLRMRRFDQRALLAGMASRGELTAVHIDDLARQIAVFQRSAMVAGAQSSDGQPERIRQVVLENLPPLHDAMRGTAQSGVVDQLARWIDAEALRLAPLMASRHASGHIREGHGDLHLANIVWLHDQAVLFDALEFSAELRWIDTVADVAFVFMDLHAHGLPTLAWRFINAWVDETGDHAGLALLPFYAVYRALVRAKVAALRSTVPGDAAARDMAHHIELAAQLAQPREPALYIAMGVSGSGKTSQSRPLVEQRGLIALHSDVERKRLFGLSPTQASSGVAGGIYTSDASVRTYAELRMRARTLIEAGLPVLVDAVFLRAAHRAPFIALAAELGVPCRLLHFDAPDDVLRERVRRRAERGGDTSEATVAVLEQQLRERESLTADEAAITTRVDTQQASDWSALLPNR